MSYILLLILLGSISVIFADTPSELDRIKERLEGSGKQLSILGFSEPPEAASYLNHDLTKNSPHKLDVTKQITKLIREWSPRLLALDATCPYYFSKFSNSSIPDEDINLLSYLLAIESNKTLKLPFMSIFPKSMRNAVPLLSVFRCNELVHPNTDRFFRNVELIVGPGKTELRLQRQGKQYAKLYCSLYGRPHFVLVNQTKQPATTYNAETLLAQDNLADVDFALTSLDSGHCLYVPPDWVAGVQLNNSISLVFTLKNIEKPLSDEEPLSCTDTNETTIDDIKFSITDNFNITEIGLIVYFYQYLNPPMFDREYNRTTFFEYFQKDRNISQLIIKWTPSSIKLIDTTLFNHLDVNRDEKFNVDDYFGIKQSSLKELQNSIQDILEQLRHTVIAQYNELNETIAKFTQHFAQHGVESNTEEALENLLQNLPDKIKEKLKEKNVDIEDVLNKVKDHTTKQPSTKQKRVREDDASILFDKKESGETATTAEQRQEEEEDITAEPNSKEDELHRTDL